MAARLCRKCDEPLSPNRACTLGPQMTGLFETQPSGSPDSPDALALPRDFDARYGDGLRFGVSLGGGGLFFVAWQVSYLHELTRARDRPRRRRSGRGHVGRIARGLDARSRPPRPPPSRIVGAGEAAQTARRARTLGRSPPEPAARRLPVPGRHRRRARNDSGGRARGVGRADAVAVGDGAQRRPDPRVAEVAVAGVAPHVRGRLHG